jgi:hypothetical protein
LLHGRRHPPKPDNLLVSQLQAVQRHPQYRWGSAAAILLGLVGYAIATVEKKNEGAAGSEDKPAASSSSTGEGRGFRSWETNNSQLLASE